MRRRDLPAGLRVPERQAAGLARAEQHGERISDHGQAFPAGPGVGPGEAPHGPGKGRESPAMAVLEAASQAPALALLALAEPHGSHRKAPERGTANVTRPGRGTHGLGLLPWG